MDYPGGSSDEKEEDDEVDYAVVSDSGVMRPEPRTDNGGDEERDDEPERHESPLLAERGIRLQTSRKSYLFTYVLAALVAVFAYLSLRQFGIAYYWAPQGMLQIGSDAVYWAFVLAIASFAGEADFERGMRHYLITNSEIVKVEGILRKNRVIIPYQSVSNVTVHKGIMGRLLDFGDVNVVGFDAQIEMKGVGEPDTFYRIINNKISRMRGVKPSMPAPVRDEDVEEQPSIDWRSEQKSIGSRIGQPAEEKPSLFSSLKSRVQSAPAAKPAEKPALKPRKKTAAKKAKKR
ncbi:MAG: PH domain-containing protein [Candidatus Aenigmarchaeota archaeon]|nr:PH domain-containing protein [Candidatus Aenigmarchaeota archaeon]